MSKYARVLERVKASGTDTTAAKTSSSSERVTLSLLPNSGVRRQELERLRSAVILANQLQGVQVILICGTRADDGATTVAVELALMLAEMDRTPVALADLSQSLPGVEPLLEPALPGRHLKEILPQSSRMGVLQTRVKNFYLVEAEQGRPSMVALLQPMDLLKRLRERFKYVLLNAPPVVSHPDTALLATKVDGVMIVAQTDKSRLDDLSEAKTEFERVNANIMGVVLSQRKEHLPKMLADHV